MKIHFLQILSLFSILPFSDEFVYIKQMNYRKLMYVYFELVQHIPNNKNKMRQGPKTSPLSYLKV